MPAEMSALIEALAKVLGRKTSECEQLQQEIARLTERCDAYREALEGIKLLAMGDRSYSDDTRLRLIGYKCDAALASPAGEQKDKTT